MIFFLYKQISHGSHFCHWTHLLYLMHSSVMTININIINKYNKDLSCGLWKCVKCCHISSMWRTVCQLMNWSKRKLLANYFDNHFSHFEQKCNTFAGSSFFTIRNSIIYFIQHYFQLLVKAVNGQFLHNALRPFFWPLNVAALHCRIWTETSQHNTRPSMVC